jgi:hypothetical protein
MKFLSSPSTVNAPGTFMLRKPRLAKAGIPRPLGKFVQPAGVPRMKPVQAPKVKMISISALAPHTSMPKIPKI